MSREDDHGPVCVTINRDELRMHLAQIDWVFGWYDGASKGRPLPSAVRRSMAWLTEQAGLSE